MSPKECHIIELVSRCARELVQRPELITLDTRKCEAGNLYIVIHTNGNKPGNVIGEAGNTGMAIRTLAKALGKKHNLKGGVYVDID